MEWYLVIHRMSDPEVYSKMEEIDESTELVRFRYPKEKRLAIRRVRERYKKKFKNLAFLLCPNSNVYVTTKENVPKIKALFEEADRCLKQIDPNLSASVAMIPLKVDGDSTKSLLNYAIIIHTMNLMKQKLKNTNKLSLKYIGELCKLANNARELISKNGGDAFLETILQDLINVFQSKGSLNSVIKKIREAEKEIKETIKEMEFESMSILI